MEQKLFDRNSYEPKTISTFQVIAAYMVDVYYNHLYNEAVKFKNSGKVSSITEGYRHAVYAFLEAVDPQLGKYNSKHYTRMIEGIKNYFSTYTSFGTLTISDCIDKVTSEFIPKDFQTHTSKDQKRNILKTVLIHALRDYSRFIIHDYIKYIIDSHDDVHDNSEIMKEKFVDLLIVQREATFRIFLNPNAEDTGGKELISAEQLKRLQDEIKKMQEEKKVLREYLTKAQEKLKEQQAEIESMREKSQQSIKMAKYYRDLYEVEKKTNGELTGQIAQLANREPNIVYKDRIVYATPERPTPERTTPERPTPERPTPERTTRVTMPERPTPESNEDEIQITPNEGLFGGDSDLINTDTKNSDDINIDTDDDFNTQPFARGKNKKIAKKRRGAVGGRDPIETIREMNSNIKNSIGAPPNLDS